MHSVTDKVATTGQVTYSLPLSAVLRKPLTIVTGLLGVFVTAWFVGKIDTSIGRGAR